ncbi:hypothetical protein Bhyg_01771 [Pseudolycoriella hygida]|uniref:Uncharacterized protein n=1 Tax=Pseudolycoriella hygida TaxID=35572 RepID=A0A9Q0NAJ8_9DIPT|nr:hypothetical protein Bhyg_01771 [Pseudolycoriella hygida]
MDSKKLADRRPRRFSLFLRNKLFYVEKSTDVLRRLCLIQVNETKILGTTEKEMLKQLCSIQTRYTPQSTRMHKTIIIVQQKIDDDELCDDEQKQNKTNERGVGEFNIERMRIDNFKHPKACGIV